MNRWFRIFGAAAVTASLLASSAFAQHAGKGSAKSKDGANDDVTVTASGQQVAVDPQTGKIRQPTNEEIKQLTDALKLNDSVEGLSPVTLDNGATMVDLQDRMQSVAIAKINADGTVSEACVKNGKQASSFLKNKSTVRKQANKASTVVADDPSTWEVK